MTTRISIPQDRESVELDPRRAFTPKQRLQILLASDGRCVGCRTKLGKTWHCDHVLPWNQGGRTEVGNGQALCDGCDGPKTSADTTRAAKTKRQAKLVGPREPGKRPMRSRGFDKTLTKHMDGTVTRRAVSERAAQTERAGSGEENQDNLHRRNWGSDNA